LQRCEIARALSEPLILFLLERDIIQRFVYFSDEDTPIDAVANALYSELLQIYQDYPNNTNKELAFCEVKIAFYIKSVLRLIKYSCTVIDERLMKESAFQKRRIIDLIQTDDHLNPHNWKYLSDEQFTLKVIHETSEDNVINWLCPISNYRFTDVFNMHNLFLNTPLLILSDLNFSSSIHNLVSKYIENTPSNPFDSSSAKYYDVLYIGHMEDSFPVTHTKRFDELYNAIKRMCKFQKLKDYEIVISVEYVPMRAYVISVCFKAYIFIKEENVGYILHSFICGSMTDKVLTNIFYTKAVQWFVIDDILSQSFSFFNDLSSSSHDVSDEKVVKVLDTLIQCWADDELSPTVPELIIYPE
jgi:hypothetical protein